MATFDLTNDSDGSSINDTIKKYSFQVGGNPQAMPRSRFFRRGFFNTKRVELLYFRSQVQAALPRTICGELISKGTPVKMSIKFFIKRPLTDFKRTQRAEGNLKARAQSNCYCPIAPDIDNLAKFVLDALNGLVYSDDRQVVVLSIVKYRDSMGLCEGRTEVEVEALAN
jgi:Holliday junction resolvase RusA-like endonuclease